MKITVYTRLDKFLIAKGYCANESRARQLIETHQVKINGQFVTSPAFPVNSGFIVNVLGKDHPWVNRSGVKLDHALQVFKVGCQDRVALDVGIGVGGFTDVLLQHGVRKVYGVDTGTLALHERLQTNEKLIKLDQSDVRTLSADLFTEPFSLIVSDISYLSLKVALNSALALAQGGTDLLAVIKPRFELPPEQIGKDGFVASPALQKQACSGIESWLRDECGWHIHGFTPSPIEGDDGNREFLVHASKR